MMLSVEGDVPAKRAGIIIGDILLALGDAHVADTDDVQTAVRRSERSLRGGRGAARTDHLSYRC